MVQACEVASCRSRRAPCVSDRRGERQSTARSLPSDAGSVSALTGRARDAVVHTQPRIRGLLPGDLVAGKYRVDRALGAGGMGVVVVATDVQLGRQVAIKAMNPMLAADERAVERFLREARAAVRLSGDHTVRVFDVGELPSGVPYIAMELLVGRDLATLAAERGRLPPREAVELMLQAAEGIAEAHGAGIVHRDLKPANLFLARRSDGSPLVKVLDFGLAKAPVGEGTNLTSPSAVMGTHHYMSPEQLRGSHDVDARTDIWAFGVCLYELLTGKMPFRPPTSRDRRRLRAAFEDLSRMIVFGEPKPAHEVVADVPLGLSKVIMRCLEKNRDDRFSDVADLAAALEPYASIEVRGTAARIERVLEEETVVTGDVALNVIRRERPDSTTEKIERPLAREHVDQVRAAARRIDATAAALVVFVRQLVHRAHGAVREGAPSAWNTLLEERHQFVSRAVRAARGGLAIAFVLMRRSRTAWAILAATSFLIALTCFLVAFVGWIDRHGSVVGAVPTSSPLPADPAPPLPTETAHEEVPPVADDPPRVEAPKESRPGPLAPPARSSTRLAARPMPSAPPTQTATPTDKPAPTAAPAARESCASPRYKNAQGIWKWKIECL